MEQTIKFQKLLEYLNNIDNISCNPLLIESQDLKIFQQNFEDFENEILINSNTKNDKARFEKILNKINEMLLKYFIQYEIEYHFLNKENPEKFSKYKEPFSKLKIYLNQENKSIKQGLDLAKELTIQKKYKPLKLIYSPILSLNTSPTTRISLKFCYVLNFLNIVSRSKYYKTELDPNKKALIEIESYKKSYILHKFNMGKDKKDENGVINPLFFKSFLSQEIQRDYTSLTKIEKSKQALKNRLYLIAIDICYLYKVFIENDYNIINNTFTYKRNNVLNDLDEFLLFTIGLNGSRNEAEIKDFMSSELKFLSQALKTKIGIDINKSPFKTQFKRIKKECKKSSNILLTKVNNKQAINNEVKPIKYKAKENALAYIFDLWANGNQIPLNRVEGGINAKELKRIGKEVYKFEKPDTFYRAVRNVLEYDLNNKDYLEQISLDWYNAVKQLSKNWEKTEQYLKEKKLSMEQ